jgi:hypothetical protein
MSIAALRDENEQLKALLAQTQAALSEHQGALAASEEARRRLEVILGELRRDKFGAKSEKLRPDQYHLPLEDVEIAQGILDAAQERAEAVIKGRSRSVPDQGSHRNRGCLPAHLPRVERIIEPASTQIPSNPPTTFSDASSNLAWRSGVSFCNNSSTTALPSRGCTPASSGPGTRHKMPNLGTQRPRRVRCWANCSVEACRGLETDLRR